MLDDFLREIHVDIWPIEVPRRRFLNIQNYFYRLILEPRKFVVWHKELVVVRQQPDSMTGNICYFNRRRSVAMR